MKYLALLKNRKDMRSDACNGRGSWLLLLFVLLACACVAGFDFVLLHTGDIRARLDPINFRSADCPPDTDLTDCNGGVARRAARIAAVSTAGTLVVDSGNMLQGSVYYYVKKGLFECDFYNSMGYEAISLGTRELYDGPEVLADFLECAGMIAVSANADYSQDDYLRDYVKPLYIADVNGELVGYTGFVTEELQQRVNNAGNVTMSEPLYAVRGAVQTMLNQGVNKIIVVCSEDALLDELIDTVIGIDIIILNTQKLYGTASSAVSPYPTTHTAPGGTDVLVVAAGRYGEYLGELYVTFNTNGVITAIDEVNSGTVRLTSSFPSDTAIEDALEAEWALIETSYFDQILGYSTVELPAVEIEVRRKETLIGNLVADALREEGGTQIAILNAGTINTDSNPTIPRNITLGDLISVGQFLFSDTLSTLKLPGHAIVAALENGVSRLFLQPPQGGTGRFPFVSGLRFSWNRFEPPFKRVIHVWVDVTGSNKRSSRYAFDEATNHANGGYLDEDYYWDRDPYTGELRRTEVHWAMDERSGSKRAFVPIDPDTMYTVTTGSFLRDGGDGYSVIPQYAVPITYFGTSLDTALINYLDLYSPVSPMIEGRILRTNETQPNLNDTSSDDDGTDVDVTLVAVLTSLGGAFGCMALFAALMVILFVVQTRRRNKKRMHIQLKEPNFKELTFAASYMLQEMEQKTKQRKGKKKSTVNRKPTVGYTHIFDEIKPSAARLDIVEQLALDLNFVTALNVVAAPMQSTTSLAEALVYAHSTSTRSPGDVVLHLLLTDLHAARDQSTLLREDTLGASAFKTFAVLAGLPYLWHTFAYTFAELELQAGEKEEERMRADTSGGGSNSSSTTGTSVPMSVLSIDMHNVEINEEHLNDDTDATVNKLQLLLILQKLFNQIVRSLPAFPKHLKYLCYQLREANPYPESISKIIGALVFLRFLCPAFIVPHQFGLMKAPPPSGMQRLLILITKVMQNLANHVRFGEKEKFMIKMNEFIENNTNKIDAFFQRLAEPIAEPPLNDPPSMVVPKHVRKAALYKIDTFVQQHGESILRALGEMDEGDTADAMSRLSYLMQDTTTHGGFRGESAQPLTPVILQKDEDEDDIEAGKERVGKPDSGSESESSEED